MLGEWPPECIALENIWFFLPYSIFVKTRSDKKCCHIWAGATQSSLSSLENGLLDDKLFFILNRQNVAKISLLYRSNYGRCTDEVHPLLPPARTYTARTHHAAYTMARHPHSLRVLFLKCKYHSDSIFLRILCGTNFPENASLTNYTVGVFKPRINRNLSYSSS